jgi:hypothetical protein
MNEDLDLIGDQLFDAVVLLVIKNVDFETVLKAWIGRNNLPKKFRQYLVFTLANLCNGCVKRVNT